MFFNSIHHQNVLKTENWRYWIEELDKRKITRPTGAKSNVECASRNCCCFFMRCKLQAQYASSESWRRPNQLLCRCHVITMCLQRQLHILNYQVITTCFPCHHHVSNTLGMLHHHTIGSFRKCQQVYKVFEIIVLPQISTFENCK